MCVCVCVCMCVCVFVCVCVCEREREGGGLIDWCLLHKRIESNVLARPHNFTVII